MSQLTYALVTPSFGLDFERCQLLVDSVERFVPKEIRHYLVVDRRDVSLFKSVARNGRTEVLVVEDIVPRWIQRIPGVRRFWWSWRSLPIKNWILQQIVKLSVVNAIQEEVLLFVDSDVMFTVPYDPRSFEKEGKVPLFVETGRAGIVSFSDEWHGGVAQLLGLPVETGYDTNFVGNVICWRRPNILRLHQRVAEVARRDWQLAIAPRLVFSEYILYGLFVTRLNMESSGQYPDGMDRTLCYWSTDPLDEGGLRSLRDKLTPSHHSVMISAKSPTRPALIRKVFL